MILFFFFKQKTAYEMRISDWSSDVCSSDLMEPPMRDGLAKAYARKFTGAQLTDLNSFLATPTGKLYAGEWMALQADPEVMVAVIRRCRRWRSEERRVGKEGVSPCRSRWSPVH